MKNLTNITEMLQELLNSNNIHSKQFVDDNHIYKQLIDTLPQRFPCPTTVCTKSSDLTIFDVVFTYKLTQDEKAEPLRMLLSMVFGASTWEGTLSKDDSSLFCISSIVNLGPLKLQLILEADLEDYFYKPSEDHGTTTTGLVSPKKFIPFDVKREYVSAQHFYEVQVETAISEPLMDWWSDILERLITNVDSSTPKPTHILGAFGSDHDIDFVYQGDMLGELRYELDNLYSDTEWHFYWLKEQAIGNLLSKVVVPCSDIDVTIHLVISNPRLDLEHLIFEEETDEYIKYKALRETDTDFLKFLSDAYNEFN